MAEKKTEQDKPAAEGSAPAKVSKQEAVRRALQAMGPDAKPTQMQGWIRENLGIEMSTDHISTAKGDIKKQAAQKGKGKPATAAKSAAQATATGVKPAPKPAPAATGRETAIPLADILLVQELVERLGSAPLHTLVDAFAK